MRRSGEERGRLTEGNWLCSERGHTHMHRANTSTHQHTHTHTHTHTPFGGVDVAEKQRSKEMRILIQETP